MLAIWGMGLTALGTILAIAPPTIGAEWSGDNTPRREMWRRIPYYTGIVMIVVGTLMQLYAGWPVR